MFKLNEINTNIKDNFQNIIDGKFDGKLEPPYLELMLELSFLFNHLIFKEDNIIFEYNNISLSFKNDSYYDDEILSFIRREEIFKSSYNLFLRDFKINKIISNGN
jgi:hypothetical protein